MSYLDKDSRKWGEFCEHVKTALEGLEAAGIVIAGCGDCGSAWVDCKVCEVGVVDCIQQAYIRGR